MSSSSSYRPTPLERAYASHLLAAHFATPFDPNYTSGDDDESIRVPGRNAVPFLTSAPGVERSLLRLLWSAVDPDAVGTLTQRSQVYMLLRLVAMAQAHMLPPLHPAMGDEDKLNLLKETLRNNARLVVALPTFTADVNCPSVARLLGTYPAPKRGSDVAAADYAAFGNTSAAGTNDNTILSVSDAFGSLAEVEDRPLAPLQLPPPVEDKNVVDTAEEEVGGDDGQVHHADDGADGFGNFDSVPAPPVPVQATRVDGMVNDQDDFGNFDSVPHPTAQVTSVQGLAHDQVIGEPQIAPSVDGDAFMMTENNQQAEQVVVDQSFGDFGDFDSVPPSQSISNIVPEEQQQPIEQSETMDTDFGGFESTIISEEVRQEEGDEFGGFATSTEGVEFVDMGSSASETRNEVKLDASAAQKVEEAKEEGGDDSFGAFGDFEVAPAAVARDVDATAPVLGTYDGQPTLSITDAFDTLVGQNNDNEAISTFGAATTTDNDDLPPTAAVTDAEEGNDDGEGEFGDFEGTMEQNQVVEANDGFSDFGSGEGATDGAPTNSSERMLPTPSLLGDDNFMPVDAEKSEQPLGDDKKVSAFDALVEVKDMPLPPLGSFYGLKEDSNDAGEVVEEEGFGDFGPGQIATADDAADDNQNVEMTSSDSLPIETQDPQLPPLGSISTSIDDIVATASENAEIVEDDKEFGGFEAPGQDTSLEDKQDSEEEPIPRDGLAAIDSTTVSDSTAAITDNVIESSDNNADENDNKLSAFDALVGIQDAPLPSLTAFSSYNEGDDKAEDDLDDFGDFDQAAGQQQDSANEEVGGGDLENSGQDGCTLEVEEISEEQQQQNANEFDNDNDVENFEETDGHNNAITADDGKDTAQKFDNGMGAWTFGVNNNNNTGNEALSSVFDAFGEVQDAPLPPLGAFSSAGETNTSEEATEKEAANDEADDDFGDFEGTVQDSADSQHVITGQDAPLPILGALSSAGETEFGDFEVTAVEKDEGAQNDANTGDGNDMFNAFASSDNDAALPDLKTTAEKDEEVQNDANTGDANDMFNAFASSYNDAALPDLGTTAEKDEEVQDDANTGGGDDMFNAFASSYNDAPLPSLGTMGSKDETMDGDGFGMFSGPGEPDSDMNEPESANHGRSEVAEYAFGDFNGNVSAVKGEVNTNISDDQLLFGDFEGTTAQARSAADKPVQGSNEKEGTSDNNVTLFDAFSEIPPPPLSESNSLAEQGGGGRDLFGDFNGGRSEEAAMDAQTTDAKELPVSNKESTVSNEEDGAFGDFEAVPGFGQFETVASVSGDNNNESGFGNFDAFEDTAAEGLEEDTAPTGSDEHEPSPAEDAKATKAPAADAEDLAETSTAGNEEDGAFGDFETVPAVAINETSEAQFEDSFAGGPSAGDDDEGFGDFGDFNAFEDTPAQTSIGDRAHEENSPDMAREDGQAPNSTPQADADDDDFDDFNAFEDTADDASPGDAAPEKEQHEPTLVEDKVIASELAADDDEGFGFGTFEGATFEGADTNQNTGDAAGEINPGDLGDGFGDFSSFEDAPTSQPQESAAKKGDLEEILRRNLGVEYGRLPAIYTSIVRAVETDLQRGSKIIDYVANSLPPKDKAFIIKSKKLQHHILGLAEFVRIVRSITATIGELLGVDKSIDVEESTLNKWNDNTIVADVIVIEYLWSEMISKAVALGVVSESPHLESIVEIRAIGDFSIDNAHRQNDDFCQLTLQPFKEGSSSTRSPVLWNGKKYMACAANFCMNRVPELSI